MDIGANNPRTFYETPNIELYNLHDDPGEQHDLAAANLEKVRDLAARLDAWRLEVKGLMPTPDPTGAGVAETKRPTMRGARR